MAIAFRCPCGKSYQLAESAAGRKAKCTACSAVLLVPHPPTEPEFEIIVEDDPPARPARKPPAGPAFEVVEDDPPAKPKPAAKGWEKKPPPRRAAAAVADDDEPDRPRKRKGKRKRKAANADGGKRALYLVGGVLLVLVGIGVGYFAWQSESRRAGRGVWLGVLVALSGLGTAAKGATGNFDDGSSDDDDA